MRQTRVLLDANVLVDAQVRDLFCRFAEAQLIDVRWTEQILSETERALVNHLDLNPEDTKRLSDALRRAFPFAAITDYGYLTEALRLPDPDDRHVLAAAVHGECDLLVTANVRDFPDTAVADADVAVLSVDDALSLLASWHRNQVADVVAKQVASLRRPPVSMGGFIDRLATRAPTAAAIISAELGIDDPRRQVDEPDDHGHADEGTSAME